MSTHRRVHDSDRDHLKNESLRPSVHLTLAFRHFEFGESQMTWKTTLAVCVLSPVFAQTTVTYSYNGLALPIYTAAANTITVAGITVPRELKVTKVTAQVQIQYPNS